jgi:hypothetical protein
MLFNLQTKIHYSKEWLIFYIVFKFIKSMPLGFYRIKQISYGADINNVVYP